MRAVVCLLAAATLASASLPQGTAPPSSPPQYGLKNVWPGRYSPVAASHFTALPFVLGNAQGRRVGEGEWLSHGTVQSRIGRVCSTSPLLAWRSILTSSKHSSKVDCVGGVGCRSPTVARAAQFFYGRARAHWHAARAVAARVLDARFPPSCPA